MKKLLILATLLSLTLSACATTKKNSSQPAADPVKPAQSAIPVLPTASTLPPVKLGRIPILMYHYIRTYHKPSDQLGDNLSVSPTEFAGQLDQLEKLGYHTVTFKDLAANRLPSKPIILSFDDGYQDFYSNALPELKRRHMKAVVYIIAGAIDIPGYMTKNEIKKLGINSIEIGDHTWTHANLSQLPPKKLQTEIAGSKKYLESIIKQPVISFCYPSGRYNEEVRRIVEQAGYRYAVTTEPGEAGLAYALTLYRYRVGPATAIASLLGEGAR